MTTERKKDAKVTHHKSKQEPQQSTASAATAATATASSSPISETHTPTYSNVAAAAAASSQRQDPISKSTPTQSQPQSQNPSKPSSKSQSQPRQVIAVSASKNPAAFFNLARRFLVTDEFCDLSALEGAIVSAVDAAHLLERSKLAHIVRYVKWKLRGSYVTWKE